MLNVSRPFIASQDLQIKQNKIYTSQKKRQNVSFGIKGANAVAILENTVAIVPVVTAIEDCLKRAHLTSTSLRTLKEQFAHHIQWASQTSIRRQRLGLTVRGQLSQEGAWFEGERLLTKIAIRLKSARDECRANVIQELRDFFEGAIGSYPDVRL